MTLTAPLAHRCGNWKRRGRKRRKSVVSNDTPEKRIGKDGTKRKLDQHIEERLPDWIIRQAAKAKALQTRR